MGFSQAWPQQDTTGTTRDMPRCQPRTPLEMVSSGNGREGRRARARPAPCRPRLCAASHAPPTGRETPPNKRLRLPKMTAPPLQRKDGAVYLGAICPGSSVAPETAHTHPASLRPQRLEGWPHREAWDVTRLRSLSLWLRVVSGRGAGRGRWHQGARATHPDIQPGPWGQTRSPESFPCR